MPSIDPRIESNHADQRIRNKSLSVAKPVPKRFGGLGIVVERRGAHVIRGSPLGEVTLDLGFGELLQIFCRASDDGGDPVIELFGREFLPFGQMADVIDLLAQSRVRRRAARRRCSNGRFRSSGRSRWRGWIVTSRYRWNERL